MQNGSNNFRNMQAAVSAIAQRQPGLTKPTLRRYSWSRLHTDLLDDNRWVLVAHRAKAPLPIVEALVIRLEIQANKSQPRGFIGDFDAEAMALRWGVDIEMVLRIFEELEQPGIGWIEQDQIVNFWPRNPDAVDETNAERQRRFYHRKKWMKLLAALTRQGLISDELRREREVALKEGRDPEVLIASWGVTSTVTLTRQAVRLTTRSDQIINQEGAENAKTVAPLGANPTPIDPAVFSEAAKALQWLKGDGEALVIRRLGVMRSKACQAIEHWSLTLGGDLTALVEVIHGSLATSVQGDAYRKLIDNAVARRANEQSAPALPLPPVPVTRSA